MFVMHKKRCDHWPAGETCAKRATQLVPAQLNLLDTHSREAAMFNHDTNDERKKEGEVHKGLPEAAPNHGNAYEEDDLGVTGNPNQHGEAPRPEEAADNNASRRNK